MKKINFTDFLQSNSFLNALHSPKQIKPILDQALTENIASKQGSVVCSINAASKSSHVTIQIQNLINGGVNIHSSSIKEGALQAKDIVTEALLAAVNDTRL